MAALLTFALLALSSVPASAWPRAPLGQPDGHAAAVDCEPHGGHDGAVPAPPGREPARGHPGHDHDSLPALACCVALQCPMLLTDPRPAPAEPIPAPGSRVRAAATVRHPAGLDIAPALPPPRRGSA